jgi:hypothetical protein
MDHHSSLIVGRPTTIKTSSSGTLQDSGLKGRRLPEFHPTGRLHIVMSIKQ